MKGLLLKDYYMFMKYCKTYLLIVVIFVACSLLDRNNLFMLAYPAVLCGITVVSLIGYDEKSRWQQYCETLPYTRKQVVACKYIFSMILIAGLSVLIAAAHCLAGIVRNDLKLMWVLTVFCLIWSVGNLFCAVILPMIFKYGSEKGRLMYIGVVAVFCVGFVSLNYTEAATALNTVSVNKMILAAAVVGSTICYSISLKLSEYFYLKREL